MKAKLYILLTISILFLLTGSCSDDYSLEKTVFIEDVLYPGLPIYSEWGYNSFGAYIDRKTFISTNDELPAKVIVNSDTVNLIFTGEVNYQPAKLIFSIIGYSPARYTNLISLNNTTFDLKNSKSFVTLTMNYETQKLSIIEGSLQFKKAQNLYIDEELSKTILSGYFNLKTFFDKEPIAIYNGRFDVGIGYDNFYNY